MIFLLFFDLFEIDIVLSNVMFNLFKLWDYCFEAIWGVFVANCCADVFAFCT